MGFVRREYSKSRVEKAGDRIAKGTEIDSDWDVLANWRGVHTYILNTFRGNIRRLVDRGTYEFAQRLKRKNTIVNKLRTKRGGSLASMHDIAGCRIICKNLKDLEIARDRVHSTTAKHVYLSEGKYDYLKNPKSSGYRGRHDVFSYQVNSTSGADYNGLKVEIQYRTEIQHAWATALEISDLIDNSRVKFDVGSNPDKERFFVLASEYLAREHEGEHGFLPTLPRHEIVDELFDIESRLHILTKLRQAHKKIDLPKSRNILLHFTGEKLIAKGFRSSGLALGHLAKMEAEWPEHDIVYVRADNPRELQSAFRNYFRNSIEFIRLMPREKNSL